MKDVCRSGIHRATFIVHHKEYVTDLNYKDCDIFFNIENLESLCQEHHNQEHFNKEDEYYFDTEGNLQKR